MSTEHIGSRMHDQPMKVLHASLKRFGDSDFKSVCPVCPDGVLGMDRHPCTLHLTVHDRCSACGQPFLYEDGDDYTLGGEHMSSEHPCTHPMCVVMEIMER